MTSKKDKFDMLKTVMQRIKKIYIYISYFIKLLLYLSTKLGKMMVAQ